MSEQKRVSLTTISSTISSGAACFLAPSTTAAASLRLNNDFRRGQDKAGASGNGSADVAANDQKGGNKTMRLKWELFQTDSCSYPEFNYTKLLHLERKKLKKLKQKTNGFSDPFERNDDDVTRIAKELELKYGSAYGSGRGRSKKDDHCDIGLGYDESDSFIDNTEAYDEIIPEEVETLEGGFYINCGALEFKKLYSEPAKTKTDEIIKMPNRPKKRVISSSSSEDSSTSGGEDDEDDGEENNKGEKHDESSTCKTEDNGKGKSNGPAEKRPKTSGATLVRSNSSTQQNGNNKKKDKLAAAFSGSSSNSPKPPVDEMGSDSDRERVRQQKTVKTTTVKDMLKAKRDNFLKMQVGGSEAKNLNGELKGAASKSSEDEDSSSEESDDSSGNSDSNQSTAQDKKVKKNVPIAIANEENSEKLRLTDTKLPELDAEVLTSIHEFRELVTSKSMTGKRFQFDENLTEVFLKIDESLLCVEKTHRNMVFAHWEYHLLLPKYYFLRKAKQLRVREEKLKSKRALSKLRKAVIEAMPGAIANYEVELRKIADLQSGSLNSEQPPKMPKKKFSWNSNLRNLLYDVYQVRWTSYPVLGTRKETLEDFINGYMRDKVVELWPSGWMRYEELQKEIERRKTAAKKAKEKKKPTPSTTVAAAIPTVATVSSSQSSSTVVAPCNTVTIASSYMKQFEDFASSSRSCANSDTDSVASSGTSGGLKRKNADSAIAAAVTVTGTKQSKSRAPKGSSGEKKQQSMATISDVNRKQQFTVTTVPMPLELLSPSKRTDHSIHSIISAAASATVTTATVSTAVSSPLSVAIGNLSAPQQKHSAALGMPRQAAPTAHVIDLDNYKSTSDILQTSKQLLHAAVSNTISTSNKLRSSSSESDGVEIVGVFQAGLPPAGSGNNMASKQKYGKKNVHTGQNSRSSTPSTVANSGFNMEPNPSMYALGAAAVKSNNNNNHSTNNNKKLAGGGSVACALPQFDVTQVVNVLKGLEDAQKQKSMQTSRKSAGKDNHHQ